jgi:hypothetical protein
MAAIHRHATTLTADTSANHASLLRTRHAVNHVGVATPQNRVARAGLAVGSGAVQRYAHTKTSNASVVHGTHVLVVTSHTVGVGLQHAQATRSVAQSLVTQRGRTVFIGLATVGGPGGNADADAGVCSTGVPIVTVAIHRQYKYCQNEQNQNTPHTRRTVGFGKTILSHYYNANDVVIGMKKSEKIYYNYRLLL